MLQMEDCVDIKVDTDEELQEEDSGRRNLGGAGAYNVAMDDMSGWDDSTAGACLRCDDFDCMLPHAEKCAGSYRKFLVCPKCQCMCATKASFDAHIESCLGLTQGCAPHYEQHIVIFEEAPALAFCEICGMYRQRRGALLDTHRYLCQRFIHEHDGGKFPFLPGELRWTVSQGAYTPPHYFHRLLAELKAGGKWSEIENRYFVKSGVADCWQQMPCEAFRDLANRAPAHPGAVMIYVEHGDDDAGTDTSSLTSCSTTSTVATSGTGRASVASSSATATTAAHAPAEHDGTPHRTDDGGRVAHVEPRRQEPARPGNRKVRRGRRAGQPVHERQRSNTPVGRPAGSAGTPVEPGRTSAPHTNRVSGSSGASHSSSRRSTNSHDDTPRVQNAQRSRRRRPRGGPPAQQQRVVNDIGGGALEIVSPRSRHSSAEQQGARGDARDVRSSPARRTGSHLYLEGAIVDHRNGNFIASVLVCGQPPSGTSSVVRRSELERFAALGVASGLQVSYYREPADYQQSAGRALSQARCQSLLFNTTTRMPAGCLWFWEPPPTGGEWLVPARDDARVNPGTEHVKMRFSPLRRG